MKKNSRPKKFNFQKCEDLLKHSTDTGKIMSAFSCLMHQFIDQQPACESEPQLPTSSIDKDVHLKFDQLFRQIVARIQWHCETERNHLKLVFIENMSSVYAHLEDKRGFFDCIKMIVDQVVKTLRKDNYKEYLEGAHKRFQFVQKLGKKHEFLAELEESCDIVLDFYNSVFRKPKYHLFHMEALLAKAKCLTERDKYNESNEFLEKLAQLVAKTETIAIECYVSMLNNYTPLEEWDEVVETCNQIFKLLGSEFEQDQWKLIQYCYARFSHARALKNQNDSEGQKALQELMTYLDTNPWAKKLMDEDPTAPLQKMYQTALQLTRLPPDLEQIAKQSMKKKMYSEAMYVLAPNLFKPNCNADLDIFWPWMILYLDCQCCLGNHKVSIDQFLQEIYFVNSETMEKQLLELKAQCFLHQHLWEEALDALLKVWKTSTFSDPKWTNVLIHLLIYKKKFQTALKVMEKDGLEKHEVNFRMVFFFLKDYFRTFDGLLVDTSILKQKQELLQQAGLSLFLHVVALRRSGKLSKASFLDARALYVTEIWEPEMLNRDMIFSETASAIGEKPQIIELLESAMASENKLEKITKASFAWLDRNDPRNLLKFIKKDIKTPNGSPTLKEHEKELQHYISSMKIAFLCRKKLKMDIDEEFLYNSRFMHILLGTSYSGYLQLHSAEIF